MRLLLTITVLLVPSCFGVQIDPLLVKFVPADSSSLLGARMSQLRMTPIYQKMVAQQKLPQLEQFARETGFDPRTDVDELLLGSAEDPASTLVAARGKFHLHNLTKAVATPYRGYTIYSQEDNGFVPIDANTTIAGRIPRLKLAIDQYKAGGVAASKALLDRARAIPDNFQVWAVSEGGLNLVARQLPQAGNGINFAKIFQNVEQTSFEADLRNGVKAVITGSCKTPEDAKNLSDGARGLVGFGRLSVPDAQPELLKLWDGIEVKQDDRRITLNADIPQDLIDRVVAMFSNGGPEFHHGPTPPRRKYPMN